MYWKASGFKTSRTMDIDKCLLKVLKEKKFQNTL